PPGRGGGGSHPPPGRGGATRANRGPPPPPPGPEFIAAVYRARWEEGQDISDPAVIAYIAERLGLDPVRLSTACDDPAVREHGLGSLNSLYRDGVFGVPFFINGYEKFWGVDRLPGFVSSVRAGAA
ncbi:DsbA family protein, partial [Streptomyces sp. NPDC127091]|uniref:DsbA family protein n=1 Tax=Streptomyces sp. NPDC127091 TaxID=3347134 RepID=UPI00365371FF